MLSSGHGVCAAVPTSAPTAGTAEQTREIRTHAANQNERLGRRCPPCVVVFTQKIFRAAHALLHFAKDPPQRPYMRGARTASRGHHGMFGIAARLLLVL
jgi:hypothetical protein